MGLISILSDLGSIGSTTKWAIESYQKIIGFCGITSNKLVTKEIKQDFD